MKHTEFENFCRAELAQVFPPESFMRDTKFLEYLTICSIYSENETKDTRTKRIKRIKLKLKYKM